MSFRTSTIAMGMLAGMVCLAPEGHAGDLNSLSADVFGEVRSSSGIAQMGASVFLYNRYDQLVRQGFTNETGKFIFTSLAPDIYSLRVFLASFEPAFRRNIAVAAGSENQLKINLASMLSNVEIVPASASRGALMTDDWKWVLRTSQATRPVLRIVALPTSSSSHRFTNFSGTTGVVRVSAGDGDSVAGSTAQDLGTAFAVATVVNGSARVRLSGNVGYMANSGLPTAGFRATYAADKDADSGPQTSLTVHQVYFPGLGGSANPNEYQGGGENAPALRTVSLNLIDKIAINDQMRLDYGARLDSISFLNRMTHMSPFARVTYDLGNNGMVRVAFSSGLQPQEFVVADNGAQGADLNSDLSALAALPHVSQRAGDLRLERRQTWEAGYQVVRGTRKYSAGVYSESVADAAYTMSASSRFLPASELLPDLDSSNYVFDVGSYRRLGYNAAVIQSLGDHMDLTVAAGRSGALVADSSEAPATSATGVRTQIRQAERSWATARVSVTVPGSGTHLVTSYGWTDFRSLMPVHMSLTGDTNQDEGWSVVIRQPMPRVGAMHGHLEATAEMRNILAQGYLPLNAAGSHAVLTNSPRALRGGLNFLF